MASNSKQYGLVMPKKANQGLMRPRPSVFDDHSDSGEEGNTSGATDWVRKALKRETEKGFQRKQSQKDVQKAIDEDPTVYQYDEIYEKIEEKKSELLNTKQKQDKKPRYIQSLLLQAEKRKREQERRNERIIQKEREAEGDQFKDKESFVTSAYRQKLEEFKQAEEEERQQDVIEALTDVSKQNDLSGFYRHLYRVTTGEPGSVKVKEEKEDPPPEQESPQEETEKQKVDKLSVRGEKEIDGEENERDSLEVINKKDATRENVGELKSSYRHYRKRRDSESSNSGSEHSNNQAEENLDADSDFSVDSDSSDSESNSSKDQSKMKKQKETKKSKAGTKSSAEKDREGSDNSRKAEKRKSVEKQDIQSKKLKEDGAPQENGNKTEKDSDGDIKSVENKKKEPKINIWEKRTVGEVFENALQRYYQRKAAKLANKG